MEIKWTMGERKPLGFTMTAYEVLGHVNHQFAMGEASTGAYILEGKVLAAAVGEMPVYEAIASAEDVIAALEEASTYESDNDEEPGGILNVSPGWEAPVQQQVPDEPVVSEDNEPTVEDPIDTGDTLTKSPLTFIEVLTR